MDKDNKSAEDIVTVIRFPIVDDATSIFRLNICGSVGIKSAIDIKIGFSNSDKLFALFPCVYLSETQIAVEKVICDYLGSNLNL